MEPKDRDKVIAGFRTAAKELNIAYDTMHNAIRTLAAHNLNPTQIRTLERGLDAVQTACATCCNTASIFEELATLF